MSNRQHTFPPACKHLLALAGAALCSHAVQAQPTVFAALPQPVGVEADRSGNVYVSNFTASSYYLNKFARNGRLLAQLPYSGFPRIGDNGHIARIPGGDQMFMLTTTGMIYLFGPGLTQPTPYLNLNFLNFALINRIYDVEARTFRTAGLGTLEWGDIAASWRSNSVLSLYLSAISGGFPFTFRIDLDLANNRKTWRGLVTTMGTTAGNFNRPRGIAVNSRGWVLTGLPYRVHDRGYADSVVAFPTAFPENASRLPVHVLRRPGVPGGIVEMPSVGMTTDAAGNFYVATGPFGSPLCGAARSSGLAVINAIPTQPNPRCFPVSNFVANSFDVAINPVGNIPYLTFGNLSFSTHVLQFPRLVNTAAAALQSAPITGAQRADIGKLLELQTLPVEQAD